jgi:hypothetical protein
MTWRTCGIKWRRRERGLVSACLLSVPGEGETESRQTQRDIIKFRRRER